MIAVKFDSDRYRSIVPLVDFGSRDAVMCGTRRVRESLRIPGDRFD